MLTAASLAGLDVIAKTVPNALDFVRESGRAIDEHAEVFCLVGLRVGHDEGADGGQGNFVMVADEAGGDSEGIALLDEAVAGVGVHAVGDDDRRHTPRGEETLTELAVLL